ncbi:MAG: LysR substrate-binding domain-containing protein [Burkholderiales bacterium]|jgi:DNA-binding transcriptional LysR family regulator|nr:Quorum-sensing regulator protein D [Betaproteobacteria bacterium MOLA814]|tara:strand:- start:2980 stop:3966 length:987 start_codon:yes stop_codon:yes gene_type:complete
METKWLEDFVSLAQTRSFSRSAQLRHVTQPAFSRRIQALEAWAGTDLVDRSSYPTRLTPAGKTLLDQAVDMLQALHATRAMLRTHQASAQDVIEFAVPHTLAFTFFPSWVSCLVKEFRSFNSRLIALNVHDAVMRMTEGSCDLLLIYHHPSQPVALSVDRYDMLVLGSETLYAVSKPKADGTPMYSLPGHSKKPLPYLAYSAGAYLARAVDHLLKQSSEVSHLDRVYETDMAEGLKAMALEGHGIAFLPESAVHKDMEAGRLVSAGQTPSLTMEIRLYRQKPGVEAILDVAGVNDVDKGLARSLWRHLASGVSSNPAPGTTTKRGVSL